MSDDQKANPTITLVFLHVSEGDKPGEKTFKYIHISDDDNDGRSMDASSEQEKNYGGKKSSRPMGGAQPGSIISVEYDGEKEAGSSVYPSTAKLVGQWKNEDDVVKWRSIHRARQGEIERDQAAAKAARRDLPAEYLEPFRDAYHALGTKRRQAQLLAWVIEEITRWPKSKWGKHLERSSIVG